MDELEHQHDGEPPTPSGESAAPEGEGGSTEPEATPLEEPPLELPRWIAPAIGIALVAIAAVAVWTGMRPRSRSETNYVITTPQRPVATSGVREDSGGAPGDPGPGASSVVQNEAGGAVPLAQPLPEGELPRDAIRGDATGVVPTSSFEVRRGVAFECDQPEATVFVNELPIGEVGQYASKEEPYEFPQEGSFNVRVVGKDGTEARFTVVASAGAQTDVELIRVRLAKP
ncbi:MAG: hypothetical protein HYU52_18280 [Acidobacteria bacterium]|nr:hypothetical protein [Acidobacteriota bacterium]